MKTPHLNSWLLLLIGSSTVVAAAPPPVPAVYLAPTAQVQKSPPKITIQVNPFTTPHCRATVDVWRRDDATQAWNRVGQIDTAQVPAFGDTNVQVGKRYTYFLAGPNPMACEAGTRRAILSTGIEVAPSIERKKILLLVDQRFARALHTELGQLTADLAGCGWEISQQEVPPGPPQTDPDYTAKNAKAVAHVKSIILAESAQATHLKALLLFGHIPVPYSGDIRSAHPQQNGAWSTDGYYAELDGIWQDAITNTRPDQIHRNRNLPGDGKFDETRFPSPVELAVGRVDAYEMSELALPGETVVQAEERILRQYLRKNHAFRHGQMSYPRAALIKPLDYNLRDGPWDFAASLVGTEPIRVITSGCPFAYILRQEPFLYAAARGPCNCSPHGAFNQLACALYTSNCREELKAPFMSVFGSYVDDFDNPNNVSRALICSPKTLASWPVPDVHRFFTLGETIGESIRGCHNFSPERVKDPNAAPLGVVNFNLLGDPTLTLLPVTSPTEPAWQRQSDSAQLTLRWSPPRGESVVNYALFGSPAPAGPWTLLNDRIQGSASSVGIPARIANRFAAFLVRAKALRTTASGSYYEFSPGCSWTFGLKDARLRNDDFAFTITGPRQSKVVVESAQDPAASNWRTTETLTLSRPEQELSVPRSATSRLFRVRSENAAFTGHNVVGFLKLNIPAGTTASVTNWFVHPRGNWIDPVLAGVPAGTVVAKWDGSAQQWMTTNTLVSGSGWSNPAMRLDPGDTLRLIAPADRRISVVLFGEVPKTIAGPNAP